METFDHVSIVGNATRDDVEHALDIMTNLLSRGDLVGLEAFGESLAANAAGAGDVNQTLVSVSNLAHAICFWAWGTP